MMRKALFPSLAVLTVLSLAACNKPAEPKPDTIPDAKPSINVAAGPAGAAVDAVNGATPTTPAAPTPTAGEQGGTDQWRTVATADDQNRIDRLDEAWKQALREANNQHGALIDAKGMLLVPTAGLAGNLQPGPGTYRCRTIKVGSMDGKGLAYVEHPFFKCSVELTPGGDLILTKVGGSQRTRGLLYPGDDKRLVYVGAQAWGADEKGYPTYGQMPERDQVGVFERIGAARWRLVLPYPKQESKLEVLEVLK